MFTFAFQYKKETFPVEFEHVRRAEYYDGENLVCVPEEEIQAHRFPLDRTLFLFSDEESFSASSHSLRYIQITNEG